MYELFVHQLNLGIPKDFESIFGIRQTKTLFNNEIFFELRKIDEFFINENTIEIISDYLDFDI
jgi:hypothetical protein